MNDPAQIRPQSPVTPGLSQPALELAPSARDELANARLLAKVWASTLPEPVRTDLAAGFAAQSLVSLATKLGIAPQLTPSLAGAQTPLDEPARALSSTIGDLAAQLPLLEALHQITSLYPMLLPARERSAKGAFYTPPALVARLLDQAEAAGTDWKNARVLDPAAGGGIFLIHAAARMVATLGDCEPVFALSSIGARLAGFELDAKAATLAQSAFELSLADLAARAGRPAPKLVQTCDTLSVPPEPVFDLVVGNPPYGRVTLPAALRQRYQRSLYGHANLYGVFTDAALRWTRPGGIVAYLTPTSFLGGQYYSALRRLLAASAPPEMIDFVHARRGVFEDVLQETLLAVYRLGGTPGRAEIHHLNVLSETKAEISHNGSLTLPRDTGSPWLAPRLPGHDGLIAAAETLTHRLADWGYRVSTGPLVWNRFKGQMRDRATGRNVHPLIWAESVTADGRFAYRARKRNHAPYFRLEAPDGWLLTQQPCVLVQRTTAKEQARRLIAAELPAEFIEAHGGVVIENHLNMVRAVGEALVPTRVVATLLNSRIVDELFRCISGSVAVSAFELESLPLPAPEDTATLAALLADGAAPYLIEAECARLYGFPA